MAELLHGIVFFCLFLLYVCASSAILGSDPEATEETISMSDHVFYGRLKNVDPFSFSGKFSCFERNFYYFSTSVGFVNSESTHCIFLNHNNEFYQFEMVYTLLVVNQSDSFKIFCINILHNFLRCKATMFENHLILKEYPPILKFQLHTPRYCGWMGGCAQTYIRGKFVIHLKLLYLLKIAVFFSSNQKQTCRHRLHMGSFSKSKLRYVQKLSYLF